MRGGSVSETSGRTKNQHLSMTRPRSQGGPGAQTGPAWLALNKRGTMCEQCSRVFFALDCAAFRLNLSKERHAVLTSDLPLSLDGRAGAEQKQRGPACMPRAFPRR